jgi:tripartite ATP-independent transporter DctP family solute receptor
MLRSPLHLWTFAALLFSSCAQGQLLELKLGHAGGSNSIQTVAAAEFAVLFNAELGSSASIRVYGDSALGNDSDLLTKLKTGEVSMAVVAAPMSSVAGEFGIFDMPFLVRGRQHIRLFRDRLLDGYLQPAALAQGYRVLGMWEFGVRHITNNVRPIKIPHDLAGLRFRVPKGEWRIRMFKSYGVQVTPMEIKDIYPSLQSGTLDGLEMPLPVLCSLNIHEVQKYLSLTSHLYSPAFMVIGEAQFQKQPPEVRDALLRHARGIQDWVLDRGEELDAFWLRRIKQTMEINEAERLSFTLQALPVYQQFISQVPDARAMIRLVFETDPSPIASRTE